MYIEKNQEITSLTATWNAYDPLLSSPLNNLFVFSALLICGYFFCYFFRLVVVIHYIILKCLTILIHIIKSIIHYFILECSVILVYFMKSRNNFILSS